MFNFKWREMDLAHKYDEVPVVSADKEFNKHFHNFYEIFYFISGTAMYTVENEKRLLQPHDALIIKPGEFHNVEFLDKSPYERYVLKMPVGFLASYIIEKLEPQGAFFPCQEEVLEYFQRLDKAYGMFEGNDMYYYAGSIVTEAVIHLSCSYRQQPEGNLANTKIVPVLQYINDNINKPLTLTDIANEFHYSPDYISREFYRYIKTPIMKYVRTKRILAAQKLIHNGYKPTVVAEILGFTDYSTFYRSYISVIGKHPSDENNERSSTSFPDEK